MSVSLLSKGMGIGWFQMGLSGTDKCLVYPEDLCNSVGWGSKTDGNMHVLNPLCKSICFCFLTKGKSGHNDSLKNKDWLKKIDFRVCEISLAFVFPLSQFLIVNQRTKYSMPCCYKKGVNKVPGRMSNLLTATTAWYLHWILCEWIVDWNGMINWGYIPHYTQSVMKKKCH